MLCFDAHLDLSMNALEWNRDLTQDLDQIRARERHLTDKPDRGLGTVSFGSLRKGDIGMVVATQIARYVKPSSSLPGWNSPEQAWAQTQGQLAWYKTMERKGELIQITNLTELNNQLERWNNRGEENVAIGYILSLEGADSIVNLEYLEEAAEYGLKALGPAHYGPGTYAFGTDSEGGIGHKGKELLRKMEELNLILDVTHLCDQSFWEALECFRGPIWASHSNCRSLVDHNRQFSDDQLKVLIERGAVIGGAFDAWMLVPNWERGVSLPSTSGLVMSDVINHWDHICQLAGNTNHIGIGSDLDGGFGREQGPADLEEISDLSRYPELLKPRGYSEEDIQKIMSGNWLNFIRNVWK